MWSLGSNERVYNWEATSAITSSSAVATTGAFFAPSTTEVASGARTAYVMYADVAGQERSGGDAGIFRLQAGFYATNAGGSIRVDPMKVIAGTSTFSCVSTTSAGWAASIGVDGSTTAIRVQVAAGSTNGTVDWEIWQGAVSQRGQ